MTSSAGVHVDVALCLPRDVSTVSLIRGIVSHSLLTFGVTDDCIEDICLALSEACTNVVQHAAADDEYEVSLQVDEEHCEIRVTNTGDGLDADALSDVMPDTSSARGRGVAIMRAVMDQVEFRSEPETGTIVHLVKRLDVVNDGAFARLRRGER